MRFFEKRLKAAPRGENRSGTGLQSSVGGFAYSTGWSAEFSGNSVLCGTGHCGRNLVNRVRRCSCGVSGLGACAAGEGAWGGERWRQSFYTGRDGRGSLGFVWLLFIPACFVMHVAAPTTKITQFIGFSPTFTDANCLSLFFPLTH